MNTNSERDPHLWDLAKKRAGFKRHLAIYIIINIFLWLFWYFNGSENGGSKIPWPLWSSVGWGIGLTFHYLGAHVNTGLTAIEKEYQKLKNNQQ